MRTILNSHVGALRSLLFLLVVFSSRVFLVAEDAFEIIHDVSYKTGDLTEYEQQRCKLDLYLPKGKKDFATIVWFHGGAIQNGDKTSDIAVNFGKRFANEGVAVASVNYRLHPKVQFPAYVEDAAASVAFVINSIEKHGGAKKRVFVSGHSAGGYLAAMVGVDPSFLAKHDIELSDVAGLMPVAGQMVTHSTVRIEKKIPKGRPIMDEAAPSYHANKLTPPFINFVGSKDLPARSEENRYFVAVMKAAGHKDVTFMEVEGRSHGTIASGTKDPDDVVAKAMHAFIERLKK